MTFPEDSLYDGALHITLRAGKKVCVFPLDTAAISAAEKEQPLRFNSTDGQAELVLDHIVIRGYSDRTVVVSYYEGYLFSKD